MEFKDAYCGSYKSIFKSVVQKKDTASKILLLRLNKNIPVKVCFSSCENYKNSTLCSNETLGKIPISRCL